MARAALSLVRGEKPKGAKICRKVQETKAMESPEQLVDRIDYTPQAFLAAVRARDEEHGEEKERLRASRDEWEREFHSRHSEADELRARASRLAEALKKIDDKLEAWAFEQRKEGRAAGHRDNADRPGAGFVLLADGTTRELPPGHVLCDDGTARKDDREELVRLLVEASRLLVEHHSCTWNNRPPGEVCGICAQSGSYPNNIYGRIESALAARREQEKA